MRRNPLLCLGPGSRLPPFATGSNASAAELAGLSSRTLRGEWQDSRYPCGTLLHMGNAPATAGRQNPPRGFSRFFPFSKVAAPPFRGGSQRDLGAGPDHRHAGEGRTWLGLRRFSSPRPIQPERCHLCRWPGPNKKPFVRKRCPPTTLNEFRGESPPACPQPCAENNQRAVALGGGLQPWLRSTPKTLAPDSSCQGAGLKAELDQG